MWLDVCSKQGVHQSVVVVESSFIDVLGGPVRKHSWPGYGESIMVDSKLL